jgi:hypothetical protein
MAGITIQERFELQERRRGEMVLPGISSSVGKGFEMIDLIYKLEMHTDVVVTLKSMTLRSTEAGASA